MSNNLGLTLSNILIEKFNVDCHKIIFAKKCNQVFSKFRQTTRQKSVILSDINLD